MRRSPLFFVLVLLLTLGGEALAAPTCAATISELRVMLGDATFPLTWEETSMADGKPLVVSILEKEGYLFLEFIKTGEGLWAQSAGAFCSSGADLEFRFSRDQIHVGPAANWFLRQALGGGGKFTLTRLTSERLRIATTGWSGSFSSKAS